MPSGYQGWNHTGALDLTGTSVEAPKPVPAGLYKLRVANAEPRESDSGKPMVSVQFEIAEADSGDEKTIGRKVFDNLILTAEDGFRTKNFCTEAEVSPPKTVDFKAVERWCSDLADVTVRAKLTQRTFKGRTNAAIDYYGTEPPKDSRNGHGEEDQDRDRHPPRTKSRRR